MDRLEDGIKAVAQRVCISDFIALASLSMPTSGHSQGMPQRNKADFCRYH